MRQSLSLRVRSALAGALTIVMAGTASAQVAPAATEPPPAPRPGGPNAEPSVVVQHWTGPSEGVFDKGPRVAAGMIYLKRTTDRAAKTITDEFHVVRHGQSVQTEVVKVTASKIEESAAEGTAEEANALYKGRAALTGPAWAWRERTLDVKYGNDVRMTIKETATGSGVTLERTIYNIDGSVVNRYIDRLTLTSATRFEAGLKAARDAADSMAPPE